MKRIALATLALLELSSVASADSHGLAGMSLTLGPAASTDEVETGAFDAWGGGMVSDQAYVGGQISIGNYTANDDFGIRYHALAGMRREVSPRISVLGDLGAGVTQQVEYHLGLFGEKGGFDTVGWVPSGAARVHLVGELGTVRTTTVGLALTTEAAATYDFESTGVGVGVGLYLAN
jgi:hypothetical protein